MNPDELTKTKAELEAFVDDAFASLPRSDQRAKGNLYLRGLMRDGRRKSMQPMGTRLGVDYQQLQQFVSASPWRVEPVRRVLVRRALQLIGSDAWVVDDTGFKKDGAFSPCVARQYSGTLGKIGNCQIGVSIHAATDQASCPLDWRLYVPQLWDDTCADTNEEAELIQARRAKAQLPDAQRHRTKWAMALEMIDELAAWGHRPPALVGDAGYGEITAFRCGLTDRHIPYMVVSESIHERVPRRRRHGRARILRAWPPTAPAPLLGRPQLPERPRCCCRTVIPPPGDVAPRHEIQSEQQDRLDKIPIHRPPRPAREPRSSPRR